MPRKVKEEDKVEKILRGLLKEPENRRCINCNILGPQYVCTTFCTFVCTNCSGVHREFSHRVKSVSMAKFNSEEITSLQAGGNERARQIYLKSWDPQHNFYPDPSNLNKLREFIIHVYIDRKYAGQNRYDKPSIEKSDLRGRSPRDVFLERHSIEGDSKGRKEEFELQKSNPCTKNDERSFKSYMLEERKSPQFIKDSVRSASHRNRRIEIVDDRFRDDGNVKHYDKYLSSRETRSGSMSPVSQRIRDKSLPTIRPLKDVLGGVTPVLTIAPPPKANVGKDDEDHARQQRSCEGQSPASAKEKPKQEQTMSLIDFDANPEPDHCQQKETVPSNNNNKQDSSDALSTSTNEKAATSSNLNSVEDLLFALSDHSTSPSAGSAQALSDGNSSVLDNSKASDVVGTLAITVVDQDHSSQANSNDAQALVTRQWHPSRASNDPSLVSSVQTTQGTDQSGDGSKPSGRKELPVDLFASNFTGFPQSSPGWQMLPPHALGGYAMQFYPQSMSVPSYPQPGKPSNPFDIGDNGPQAQVATFRVTSPSHGAPPGMSALQAQPSPYPTPLPQHVSPYGMSMAIVPGAYMGQQPNTMPIIRPQDAFAALNPIQRPNRPETSPALPPSSLSRGGNPFG